MLTEGELRNQLAHFTGSETWHRHPINRQVTLTDGAKEFAELAGAWWLMDIFVTELPPHLKREGFLSLKCQVHKRTAFLVADDGNGNVVWHRPIPFTDCPEGEWQFFFAEGGPAGTDVIMLPSEY